jgi:DNA sulfur modification protein DndC
MLLSLQEAIDLTINSLNTYGSNLSAWVIGYSGGKDSTATATLIDWLIATEQIESPSSKILVFCNTLMELPFLLDSANRLLDHLQAKGWQIRRTEPQLETTIPKTERFFVTMLGKGYPPPHNRFRWCTNRLKAEKIDSICLAIRSEYGNDFLGIDGIRKGESIARDRIITTSCNKEDGECGQGWFHKNQSGTGYKLSPLLHWRVCNVWDWLVEAKYEYGYPLDGVFETYGMGDYDPENDEPLNSRTGCIGCPLVTTANEEKPRIDKALETVILQDRWTHLAPFTRLADIYWRLRWDESFRHRKKNGEKGCLTLAARQWALDAILGLQAESTKLALEKGLTPYVLIQPEEVELIQKMILDRTFPKASQYELGELERSIEITS